MRERIEAYNDKDLRVTFEITKDSNSKMYRVLVRELVKITSSHGGWCHILEKKKFFEVKKLFSSLA